MKVKPISKTRLASIVILVLLAILVTIIIWIGYVTIKTAYIEKQYQNAQDFSDGNYEILRIFEGILLDSKYSNAERMKNVL